jgi:hypothetical protein
VLLSASHPALDGVIIVEDVVVVVVMLWVRLARVGILGFVVVGLVVGRFVAEDVGFVEGVVGWLVGEVVGAKTYDNNAN